MSRQPQRVHKTFYRLKLRANFFIGKGLYEKTTFCTARAIGADVPGIKFVAPWKVVRSDEYVNKRITPAQLAELNANARARNEKNREVIDSLNAVRPPYTAEELSGKTHYVGDSCPGGHGQCCPTGEPGPIGEHGQPNSDNNVSGPTS